MLYNYVVLCFLFSFYSINLLAVSPSLKQTFIRPLCIQKHLKCRKIPNEQCKRDNETVEEKIQTEFMRIEEEQKDEKYMLQCCVLYKPLPCNWKAAKKRAGSSCSALKMLFLYLALQFIQIYVCICNLSLSICSIFPIWLWRNGAYFMRKILNYE